MMVKHQKLLLSFCAIFVVTEISLGVLLQLSSGRTAECYSMVSVMLCAVFCVLFLERSFDYILTQIALVFTVGADYFLVWVKPREQLPAMVFFLIVQLMYFLRLYRNDESRLRRRCQIVSRCILSAGILIVTGAVLKEKNDAVAMISMLYYVNLFFNIVFSFAQWKKHFVFAIGLLFFILCDTVVGLSLLEKYFTIAENSVLYRIIDPGFNLAWAFYLPAQVLLVLSLLPKHLKR